MRSIPYILIIFVIYFVSSCDNEEISDIQAESFIKFYEAGMYDEGIRVLTRDDGYLVMANVENPGRGRDICLIRTDKFGNTLQDVTIAGGLFDDFGYDIEPHNSGYVITGSTRETEYGEMKAYVAQVNQEATQIEWEIDTGYSKNTVSNALLVLDNGNIVAAGYMETENGKKDILLMEMDSDGDTITLGHYGFLDVDEVACAIAETPTQYLLAGYRIGSALSGNRQICVLRWKVGTNPSIAYLLTNNLDAEAVAVVATGEDEYYLASNVRQSGSNESVIRILKINLAYQLLEDMSFGQKSINLVSDMKIVGNNLYISGTASNSGTVTNTNGDMFVMHSDLSGNSPAYYYEGDGASYKGYGFDLASDGGYILTGSVYLSNQSAVVLGKIKP
jgi:hypothetical protein